MKQESLSELPVFQQLQYQFSAHIKNPHKNTYSSAKLPGLVKLNIEPRRLKAYEDLFFNNLRGFFSNIFPVLTSIMGNERWLELIREYLQKHDSKTPLFHELGQEFLDFLQNEYEALANDPPFILELAHYEWVELAVGIEPLESVLNPEGIVLEYDEVYQLSPVAWPLVYEWPVHRLDAKNMLDDKPEWVTTLLVYRDDEDAVQFMELSPVLYKLLVSFMDNNTLTIRQILASMAETMQQPIESVTGFAAQVLQDFLEKNLISPFNHEQDLKYKAKKT